METEGPALPVESVVVAIATFRRSELLARCLRSLGVLDAAERWDRHVIVVDNDAAGSSEAIARREANFSGLRLNYAVEPRAGIAAARNRCLELASSFEFLAFIDDDETADPAWLAELLRTQQQLQADLTGGPVEPVLAPGGPPWISSGGLFTRRSLPTGRYDPETNGTLSTANLLLRTAIQVRMGEVFSDDYGLSGGSDRHLTLRAAAFGLRLAWCDEALVREWVPPERQTVGWVLRRGYRVGNVESRIDLELGRVRRRAQLAQRAVALIVTNGLWLVGYGVKRRWGEVLFRGRRIARGCGLLTGALGLRHTEYGR